MHRHIARLLLFCLAAGVCEPFLQTLSAHPPHACCLRKLHSSAGRGASVHGPAKGDGNCCPPMTTAHVAQVVARKVGIFQPRGSEMRREPVDFGYTTGFGSANSSRAPPIFS